MKSLVCPISPLRVNKYVARVTAFFVAAMAAAYALTGGVLFMVVAAIDLVLRGFTSVKGSPFSWLASRIVAALKLPDAPTDKAPKIFAARVGVVFSAAILLAHFVSPTAAMVVALILMSFALLESLLNVCVGCIVYARIVYPLCYRDR